MCNKGDFSICGLKKTDSMTAGNRSQQTFYCTALLFAVSWLIPIVFCFFKTPNLFIRNPLLHSVSRTRIILSF